MCFITMDPNNILQQPAAAGLCTIADASSAASSSTYCSSISYIVRKTRRRRRRRRLLWKSVVCCQQTNHPPHGFMTPTPSLTLMQNMLHTARGVARKNVVVLALHHHLTMI
jgi:hypothetical protein